MTGASGNSSAFGRSTEPSRTGPVSRFKMMVPSGARKPTTGAPAICSGTARAFRTRCARTGASGNSSAVPPPTPRRRMCAPPIINAQSDHGSPVTSPSCNGWTTTVFSGSASSGRNSCSGWIQNRSAAVTAGTTRAPSESARARSLPARARRGAALARTAASASPRASARAPVVPCRTPPTMVRTLPAWIATCCAAVRAYWPSICSQRVAEPISARASDPSGMTRNSAVCRDGAVAPSRRGAPERAAGTGRDKRGSWRNARSSRLSLNALRTGLKRASRAAGAPTAGMEACSSIARSRVRATFFTSMPTTSPLARTK